MIQDILTRVISSADRNLRAELVLDLNVDGIGTLHAKLGRETRVGEAKLATLALEATDGLSCGALESWPLCLLIAWRAGVRAEHALRAAV